MTQKLPEEARFFQLPQGFVVAAATTIVTEGIEAVLNAAKIPYDKMGGMDAHALLNLPRIANFQKFYEQNGVLSMTFGFVIGDVEALEPLMPAVILITNISQEDINTGLSI
jgi:hypothetical protein